MSENPVPPQNPPPPAPTPGTVKVTGIERTGTGLTVVGVVAAAIPLIFLAFASNIKLDTIGSISSVLTTGLLLTIAGLVAGLVATGLNLPNLGKRLGPGLSTVFSGATLVTMALFLFVTVLPRVSAIRNLNDNIVPFGTSLNTNCKNPLNSITNDYKKVQADATPLATIISAIPTGGPIPTQAQLLAFSQTISGDTALFATDATNFQGYQAALNKLTSPASKYDKLLADCKKDVAGTLDFLSGSGIATPAFVTALNQIVDSQGLPATAVPVVKGVIAATIPATYNAGTLVKAAGQATSGQLQFTLPPGLPDTQVQQLSLVIVGTFALGFPGFVQAAMTQAAAATDATLTQEGDQLQQDIKDTLKNNLAPFTVDADKIISDATK